MGILTDLTMCVGCGACVSACKEANDLPPDGRDDLSAITWTIIQKRANVHVRRHCMHCEDPTCASVCPVAALQKTKLGPVVYHEDKCIGCRYCIMACPFEIPRYEWESTQPRVRKCIMCHGRLEKGEQPGCTTVCPTGATIYGDRDKLIAIAEERIKAEPARYVDHIFGLHEAGGTSVLFLSDIPFAKLGFPATRMDASYPQLTWAVLSQLPSIVSVGGVLMTGIWWITHRRIELAKQARDEYAGQEGGGK